MPIALDDQRRQEFIDRLIAHFRDAFDEDLSEFRAGEVLDFALLLLGPAVYNQAVQDVRAHLQTKLEDLDGDVYAPDP